MIGVSAGALDQRVEVQENQSTSKGSLGQTIDDWTTIQRVWAEVVTLTGRELERAQQIAGEATHQVTIRYLRGLTAKHRFVWGGTKLDINHINDTKNRHAEMVCLCKEAKK